MIGTSSAEGEGLRYRFAPMTHEESLNIFKLGNDMIKCTV